MKCKLLVFFSLGVLLMFSGCYPEGPESIDDADLVATFHDTDFDFESAGTFAIPDSVVKISRGDMIGQDSLDFVDPAYANTIIQS